jgi:hypothetical protein
VTFKIELKNKLLMNLIPPTPHWKLKMKMNVNRNLLINILMGLKFGLLPSQSNMQILFQNLLNQLSSLPGVRCAGIRLKSLSCWRNLPPSGIFMSKTRWYIHTPLHWSQSYYYEGPVLSTESLGSFTAHPPH